MTLTPFWETSPPDFVNPEGVKWWSHPDLTRLAQEPEGVGNPVKYHVFITELPSGGRSFVLADTKGVSYETQSYEAMGVHIQMLRAVSVQ